MQGQALEAGASKACQNGVVGRPKKPYKPTALRLPVLVIFLSTFGISIALIERLMQNTAYTGADIGHNSSRRFRRDVCPNNGEISSSFGAIEDQYTQLCSTFTSLYAPYSTDLSPAQQTSFGQWLLSFDSLLDSKHSLMSTSNTCRATPITAEVISTRYVTEGCTSRLTTEYDPRCGSGDGTISLDGSSIMSMWIPCAVAPESQMVITTDSAEDATATSAEPPPSQMTVATNTAPDTTTTTKCRACNSAKPPGSQMAITSNTATMTTEMFSTSSPSPSTVGAEPSNSQMLVTTGTQTQTSPTTGPTSLRLASNEVLYTPTFTKITFFLALFFAPLVAVFIKVIYEAIQASLKLIEPFQHMSSTEGATSTQSVLSQYLRHSMSKDVLQSALAGRLLPLWSAIMKILLSAAPALASAAMSVKTADVCFIGGVNRRCDPRWIINTTVVRVVEIILAVCAILVIGLIIFTWRYTWNLASAPSTIMSVAQLMNHEPLVRDLLAIDPDADEKSFAACLNWHRFWIGGHQDPRTAQQYFGIIGKREGGYAQLPGSQIQTSHNTSSSKQRVRTMLTDAIYLFTHTAFYVLLIAYFTDYKPDVFNNYFSSQSVLSKLIFVGLATLCGIQMKDLERAIRVTEPYRRLSSANAPPETTVLLQLHGTCWSNLPRCLSHLLRYPTGGMAWQSIVTIVACLSDFNIIAVAGVLFTDAQTTNSFRICSWISIGITGCMFLIVSITIFWWRRQRVVREMPRRPETIAAVMSYLCGSRIVWDVLRGGAGSIADSSLTIAQGQRYKFEKMGSLVDERVRWGVEVDDGGVHTVWKS